MLFSCNLDDRVAHLDHNWARLSAMKKKYGPRVEVTKPFSLGCVLLTCADEALTMDAIVQEFEIELWDDYYARSLEARGLPGRMGL